jgi:hypothetical protein
MKDSRPLSGVRVLDLTRVLSGSYCTAFDLSAQALSGFMAMTGEPGGAPSKAGGGVRRCACRRALCTGFAHHAHLRGFIGDSAHDHCSRIDRGPKARHARRS